MDVRVKDILIPVSLSILLILLFFRNCTVCGDLLYLNGSDYGVNVKIKKADSAFITVIIPKTSIVDISVDSSSGMANGDTLKLLSGKARLNCKILEVEDDAVLAQIPVGAIASYHIDLSSSSTFDQVDDKTDFMMETDGLSDPLGRPQYGVKSETVTRDSGRIKGSILFQERPLSRCQVRIHKLTLKGWLFFKAYKENKDEYYETITDENGNYIFEDIPTGAYKLYWKPTLGEPWIKRIEMEPDVVVLKGDEAIVSPIVTVLYGER